MDAGETGIIARPPRAGGLAAWLLLEGAWLLFALALAGFIGAGLQSLGGRAAAASSGATLFALHGLVGLHVLRTERRRVAAWLRGSKRALVTGALGGLALLAFNGLYTLVLDRFGVESPDMREFVARALPGALKFLWGAILVPIVEELYFRGRLLEALDLRVGTAAAVAISSIAFAAIHLVPVFLPAFLVFALALYWLRKRTGGLVAPIVAHAMNNLVALF